MSREALLGRQFDLIACFEQNTKRIKGKSKSNLTDGQQNTLGEGAAPVPVGGPLKAAWQHVPRASRAMASQTSRGGSRARKARGQHWAPVS